MTALFFCVENTLNFPDTEARAPDGRPGVVDSMVKDLRNKFESLGPGVQLILYGSWAKDWNFDNNSCTESGKYLNRKLGRRGLHIIDKAEGYDAIAMYVQRKHVDNYVIYQREV